jgi:hypothetical protein
MRCSSGGHYFSDQNTRRERLRRQAINKQSMIGLHCNPGGIMIFYINL